LDGHAVSSNCIKLFAKKPSDDVRQLDATSGQVTDSFIVTRDDDVVQIYRDMSGGMRLVAQGDQPMTIEMLTYADLGARLKISSGAARSFVKRLRLPRILSHDGKALVSVDLAEIKHTPRPMGARPTDTTLLRAKIETLQAEIAQLEARAAAHRADFERERERADRLMIELLQATAETMAAKESTARLEGELTALRIGGRAISGQEQAARRLGNLAATIVEADRKACR
jgi:hypothetical protein